MYYLYNQWKRVQRLSLIKKSYAGIKKQWLFSCLSLLQYCGYREFELLPRKLQVTVSF